MEEKKRPRDLKSSYVPIAEPITPMENSSSESDSSSESEEEEEEEEEEEPTPTIIPASSIKPSTIVEKPDDGKKASKAELLIQKYTIGEIREKANQLDRTGESFQLRRQLDKVMTKDLGDKVITVEQMNMSTNNEMRRFSRNRSWLKDVLRIRCKEGHVDRKEYDELYDILKKRSSRKASYDRVHHYFVSKGFTVQTA
jgi:hypothetical protein